MGWGGGSMNETSSFCQMMAETDPFSKTWVLKETQNDGMCLTLIILMWRMGELIILPENSGLADGMFL